MCPVLQAAPVSMLVKALGPSVPVQAIQSAQLAPFAQCSYRTLSSVSRAAVMECLVRVLSQQLAQPPARPYLVAAVRVPLVILSERAYVRQVRAASWVHQDLNVSLQ